MRQIMIIVSVGLLFLISTCWADEELQLQDQQMKDQKFRESYSLGYEFGANLKSREVEVVVDVLLSAVREGLEGKKPALSREDIRDTLNMLKKKVMVVQDQRFREYSTKNLEQSKAFMEANKSKEGVKILPSGLQYRVISEGNGLIPKLSDIVKVSYRGTLTDGTEFDSSHGPDGPIITRVDNMIKGWTEALHLMKVGSKWQLFVPPWLGYGERMFRRVPPNSVLIFEIELLSIGDAPISELIAPMPSEDTCTSEISNEKENTQSPDSQGQ